MKWSLALLLMVTAGTDLQRQDLEIASATSVDVSHWLNPGTQTGLLLERGPMGPVEHGALLVLAGVEAGPNADTHAANLRRGLPAFGWRSFFARVPQPAAAGSALPGEFLALARSAGAQAVVLVAEGPVAAEVARRAGDLQVEALVLINVPRRELEPNLMRDLALPTLLLQEHPHRWPVEFALGTDVELHLLSPVDPRRADNRLLRKIRGWFKRRQLLAG